MKEWKVTVLKQRPAGGHYVEEDVVAADYLLHQAGSIMLKRELRNSYPEIVKVYAPGRWLEVTGAN